MNSLQVEISKAGDKSLLCKQALFPKLLLRSDSVISAYSGGVTLAAAMWYDCRIRPSPEG